MGHHPAGPSSAVLDKLNKNAAVLLGARWLGDLGNVETVFLWRKIPWLGGKGDVS
jgi:hypothetical protein